jgi:hypothetical protein
MAALSRRSKQPDPLLSRSVRGRGAWRGPADFLRTAGKGRAFPQPESDQLGLKREFASKVFGQSEQHEKTDKVSPDELAEAVGKALKVALNNK